MTTEKEEKEKLFKLSTSVPFNTTDPEMIFNSTSSIEEYKRKHPLPQHAHPHKEHRPKYHTHPKSDIIEPDYGCCFMAVTSIIGALVFLIFIFWFVMVTDHIWPDIVIAFEELGINLVP